ncbi:MAG: WXG100 family type VII secretion target [Anaerolineae bacterium]|nr:WXG100 family type VII secretion target [Anaerolineae bacterium]
MAVDTRALLAGLREYRDTLQKHIGQLQSSHDSIGREWQRLEMVYHGDAADEFKGMWLHTNESFQEYLDRAQRIIQVLDERISFLQEADRPNG